MIFRVLMWVMIGYIVYRISQLVLRMMSSGPRRGEDIDPFASAPPQPPAQRFDNVKDADFEDITPKENGEKNIPPQGS